jgi:nucleotide-binding universal stress UspA family protein
MSGSASKYGLLIGVDGSADSEAAIRWGAAEAVMRDAPVTLMHVVAPVVVSWPVMPVAASIPEWQEENAHRVIQHAQNTLLASVGESKPPKVHTEVQHASIVAALSDATRDARMVVVGCRGMGLIERTLLGSVSSGLVHHAHCPVVIVHADEAQAADPSSPIVVGIDGSPASEPAIALAFDEASHRGAELVALQAWSDVGVFPILGMNWHEYEDQGHEVLSERLAGWQEKYPDVQIRQRIVCDQPARWLVDESERAQLVVVGSHGRGGFTGMLLGSVSSAVARTAKAPVIVVRS